MKKISLFRSSTIGNFICLFDSCVTSFRTSVSILSSAALLVSCTQGDTKNYYSNPTNTTVNSPAGNNSMSGGGGATGDGGGGQGVLCGNADDSKGPNKLWVRDIYEAVANHRLQMKEVSGGTNNESEVSKEAINILVSSIQNYLGPASPNIDFAYEQFWTNFTKQISFLDEDKELFTSQDANSPIALPAECKLVQIAYWDESSGTDEQGTLYVSRPLWRKLDQINKIGLLAHEFFFKQARKAKYRNSDFIRFKVGQLLSKDGLSSNFIGWSPSTSRRFKNWLPNSNKGFKFCEGTSDGDPTAKLQFYQYEGTDKNQHFVFSQVSSKTVNMTTFHNGHFTINNEVSYPIPKLGPSKDFAELSDFLVYSSDFLLPGGQINIGPDEDFLALWYNNAGLLTKGTNVPDFRQIEERLRKKTPKVSPTWWEGNIPLPTSTIKLSLLNPRYDAQAEDQERTLKKREDLIAALNNKLRKTLLKCPNLRITNAEFSTVFASLHAAVDKSLQQGTYLDIKEWKKVLQTAESYIRTDEELKDDPDHESSTSNMKECHFLSDKELVNQLPYILYNLKLNNYTEDEVESLLGDDAYPRSKMPFSGAFKMQLKAQQEESIVNFNLKCSDYLNTYANYIKRTVKIENKFLQPKGDVNVRYESIDHKGSNPEMLKALGHFLTQDSNYFDLRDHMGRVLCSNALSDLNPACDSYFLFAQSFSTEKEITVKSCGSMGYQDGEDDKFCAFVSLKNNNLDFVLRYEYSKGPEGINGDSLDYPVIKFIRLVPK